METDATFREVKSELVDSRLLLETSQENFTELGQDTWVRIDQLNVSPISQADRMIIFTLKSSRGTRRQGSSRHRWRKRGKVLRTFKVTQAERSKY